MFIIWAIPSAVAKNIETQIVTRFFEGFSGGTFLSVAGGTAGDIFSPHYIQTAMAVVSLAPIVGPCIGPLLGGFINFYTHWQWTYYVMLIWACILWLLIYFFAPETYHPIKLRAKAEQLRKQTGDKRYKAPMENISRLGPRAIGIALLRPFQLLFYEPMCLCLDIYSAILLGILYLFFTAFRLVFSETYGMNLWQSGMSFLGIIVGMVIAAASSPIWARIRHHLIETNEKGAGESEPEYRLPPAILGGVLIPVGLFWFAWTAYSNIHWIVPIIGCGFFGCG